MFRKLREALKKQRYRVQSDDVALPEVYTGQVAHSDAPETPEKHKSINYETSPSRRFIFQRRSPEAFSPWGIRWPRSRMRGELAAVARKRVATEGSALISHLR